jgi:hypothetical protein
VLASDSRAARRLTRGDAALGSEDDDDVMVFAGSCSFSASWCSLTGRTRAQLHGLLSAIEPHGKVKVNSGAGEWLIDAVQWLNWRPRC